MATLQKKFIGANQVDGTKIRLSNNEAIRGRNAANSADVDIVKLNASDKPEFTTAPIVPNGSASGEAVNKGQLDGKQDALGFTAVPNTRTVNGHALSADVTVSKSDVGLGNVTNDAQLKAADLDTDGTLAANSDSKIASQKATKTYSDTKIPLSQKGANSGVATLDSGGKIPASQLPNSVMEYKGTFDATATPATPLLDGDSSANTGDVYRCTVAGSYDFGSGAITFVIGDYAIYNGSVWQKAHSGADAVISVNGYSGAVSLTKSDVGLGNVTNDAQLKASDLDTDGTLAANSDSKIASQKATKTYADTKLASSSFTDAAVTGKLLTGYVSGAGTVAATDSILQSIQKLNGNIAAIPSAKTPNKESFTLTGTDITNQYVDLAHIAQSNTMRLFAVGGPEQVEGSDYTLSVPSSVTRVTFAGDLASGGAAALVSGDILKIAYMY